MQSSTESISSSAALRKLFLVFVLSCSGAVGCGNSLYALRVNQASSKLEEARNAGAEQRAPYEYTLAKEHLEKAMSEAAEADYGDAYSLADSAYEYADRAVEKCNQTPSNSNPTTVKENGR